MNLITFLMISATVLRSVSYLDVDKRRFVSGDVVIADGSIKRVLPPGKARAGSRDFVIDGREHYLLPPLVDLWVFLSGSPGGNVWVNEFIPETSEKNELALVCCGVPIVGALSQAGSHTDLKTRALGPWVTIASSQPITPYGLEQWNPHVFEVLNLRRVSDIKALVETARQTGALGVILSLPRHMNISETEKEVVKELKRSLRSNRLLLFGLTYCPVDGRVLDMIGPNILVGRLPDVPHDSVEYEIPLFLDPMSASLPLVPHATRISLSVDYAFPKVGIPNEARQTIEALTAHNIAAIRSRSPNRLLVGSCSGFPLVFFGHGTIRALQRIAQAGFSNIEALAIATANAYGFLEKQAAIAEGAEADLTLLSEDPSQDLLAITRPVALFRRGRLITAQGLWYEIDSLGSSPLVIGKGSVITDFHKDTTALGSNWREGCLGFGLDGTWQRNTLTGRKARSCNELWSKGGIINFTSGDTTAWDLSLYEGFKIAVEKCNTPCSIYVLSKAAHWGKCPGSLLTPGMAEVTIAVSQPASGHVQGIYIKPLALGEGDYSITLRDLRIIEDERMSTRAASNLFDRIERAVDLGDTTALWEARSLVDIAHRIYPTPDIRYLQAYVDYRLATMLPHDHRLRGKLVDEGLNKSARDVGIEMKILEYAFIGLASGANPLKAILHAKRLNKLADHLREEGRANARALLVLGIAQLFTPPMFGGDTRVAAEYLEESVALFNKETGADPYAWGYADALVFLSEAYRKTGRRDEAMDILRELRKAAPFYAYGAIKFLEQ